MFLRCALCCALSICCFSSQEGVGLLPRRGCVFCVPIELFVGGIDLPCPGKCPCSTPPQSLGPRMRAPDATLLVALKAGCAPRRHRLFRARVVYTAAPSLYGELWLNENSAGA